MGQSCLLKKLQSCRLWSKIQYFWQLVVCRRVPHSLISWRFLWPGKDRVVLLHRRVFLQAWRKQGFGLRLVIFLYSFSVWLLWHSWHQIFQVWFKHSYKLNRKLKISRSRQFFDLLSLALLHGIPPADYYYLRLFQHPPGKWLSFIYDHELPHWHTVMAGETPEVGVASELLGDKNAFSRQMIKNRIAAIPTIAFLAQGKKLDTGLIFTGKTLFFKPNRANQGRDCFVMLFDPETRDYELNGEERHIQIQGQANILAKLDQLIRHEDFLVQPRLVNHPDIVEVFKVQQLVTIRFITGHDGRQARPLSAVFEVPTHFSQKGWHLYTIDIESGKLLFNAHPLFSSDDEPQPRSFTIPHWPAVVNLSLRAHTQLPALPTIGWDIAIGNREPTLIEGNFNWGANQLQALTGEPLLQKELLGIYEKRLFKT